MDARRHPGGLFVVVEEAEDVVLAELGAAFEEVEFDGEADAGDFAAELADELDGGLHGAAGGEEVVDDDDALAGASMASRWISRESEPYSRS